LFVAYQDNQDVNRIGPIILTTPRLYAANETSQVNPNATCWEILTLRLGRFARQYIEKHGSSSLTDEMLQREARLILYDDADGWDQTSADNPEWLNLFKKAHGIDAGPVTGKYRHAVFSTLLQPQQIFLKSNLTYCAGINASHEVYEDLGIQNTTTVDPSFNLSNFRCLDMTADDPSRILAFECALSGSVNVVGNAFQRSSGRQTPQSTSGPSGSGAASPTSLASQALAATNNAQMPSWSNEQMAPIASMLAQCTGDSVYECTKDGLLGTLAPLNDQAFAPMNTDFSIPTTQAMASDKAVLDATDFQFPSWDQLPEDFQNPTTSADFTSTIPISTTGFSIPNVESSAGDFLAWDNEEMNFAMDMDLDLDMDMNLLGRC
jgi:hypothetical protein